MDIKNIEALNNLLSKYPKKTFLRGVEIPSFELKPEKETSSGFLVFLVSASELRSLTGNFLRGQTARQQVSRSATPQKFGGLPARKKDNNNKSILKILWQERFLERFKSELFIYKEFGQIKPEVSDYLPSLINYSERELKYLEIEYLDGYQPIGETNNLRPDLSEEDLLKVFKVISCFHFPKNKLQLPFSLENLRTYDFYMRKLIKLDTGERINKYISQGLVKKVRDILERQKRELLVSDYFVLGDRNPSNILMKDNILKIIDFDRAGWSNPAIDFTFFYVILLPWSKMTDKLLGFLRKKYGGIKDFWLRFRVDVLIRLVDEIYFWHEKDPKRAELLKINFRKIMLELS